MDPASESWHRTAGNLKTVLMAVQYRMIVLLTIFGHNFMVEGIYL